MRLDTLGQPAGAWFWTAAVCLLLLCWLLFLGYGFGSSLRARRSRARAGIAEEPALRSPASLWGLALEVLAYGIVWGVRRPAAEEAAAVWIVLAMLLAPASILFFMAAVRELGLHFRIKAVVAADHQLVTSGPYRLLRHPIYAAMLGLLVANAIVVARWEAALAAVAVYFFGTEIRVRAEERLLEQRFPRELAAYRARVRAYLPLVR
jgi:protein-S-isoprenylcysteine O-methyltransferase Ste14